MSYFQRCPECTKRHSFRACPFNDLKKDVQAYLRKQGMYDCTAFEQKPAPPPPMTPEQYSKEQEDILADVPKEFHSAFSVMAYERGHSSGYEECISHLEELVNELKIPIANFENRIRSGLVQ